MSTNKKFDVYKKLLEAEDLEDAHSIISEEIKWPLNFGEASFLISKLFEADRYDLSLLILQKTIIERKYFITEAGYDLNIKILTNNFYALHLALSLYHEFEGHEFLANIVDQAQEFIIFKEARESSLGCNWLIDYYYNHLE